MDAYLVTGGAGFIGSHIIRHLTGTGQRVRVLDNFSTGKKENLQGIDGHLEVIEGDIRNLEDVRAAVKGIDYILHLAAQVSVPVSMEDPATTYDINLKGTCNILEAAHAAGVKRLVFSSSCAVYGNTTDLPIKESSPVRPISPYASSKYEAEEYCRYFYEEFGFETVSLRYFNVFGPGQSPDSAYAAVIPKFASAITTGRQPVIYGDGEQTRDFVYVENVVKANLLACKCDAAIGRVFNIGSGIETSLNELLHTMANIAGRSVNPHYAEQRSGDIKNSVGDISLAREVLGFECATDLKTGLRHTMDSFTVLAQIT